MRARLWKSFAASRSPNQCSIVFKHMQMAVRLPFPYLCQPSKAFAERPEQKETGEHVCDHPPLLLVSVLLL